MGCGMPNGRADSAVSLPDESGTYVLRLRVPEPTSVEVGALGRVELTPGRYAYVGSAFGPGGLRARVRRHARNGPDKSLHWHVDYVRAAARLEGAVWSTDDVRHECTWAQHLRALDGARVPCPGLGASDCDCSSHFVRLPADPNVWAEEPSWVERLPGRVHRADLAAL